MDLLDALCANQGADSVVKHGPDRSKIGRQHAHILLFCFQNASLNRE